MMTQTHTPPRPTGGQLGAAAEIMVATQLMLASNGRFSCYVPLVDDDAIDVMIHDKVSHATIGLQIKSWTFLSPDRPRTVQFDIRKKTWRDTPDLALLAVAIDGTTGQLETAWLVPSAEVPDIAQPGKDKMSLRPNPRHTSDDKYARYRLTSMRAIAQALIERLDR
ncbi:MAG: hypothetical protein U9P68_00040 [Pseudomonadota bacterium]|jgi:hypothetical protein|nr:hypothetical protein [Pseudomonadota bacterium]